WQGSGGRLGELVRFNLDGGQWLVVFEDFRFGTQTFLVGTVAPEADFFPSRTTSGWVIAGLAAAALLLAWLVATGFANRVVRPLEHLVRESGRLGRLDLDGPVRVPASHEEIHALATAQESMRQELVASTRRLAEANETLEAKVEERTREL